MKLFIKFIICEIILFLTGCSSAVNNFAEFYNDEVIDTSEYIKTGQEDNVLIIETTDLEKKLKEYYNKGYILLGYSHFEGRWCPRVFAIDTAKEKGASVVILSSIHLKDVQYSYSIPIQEPHTIYHQGNVYTRSHTSGNIGGFNGVNYNSTTNGYGHFSGTSTYYTTSYVTNSVVFGYYEQIAYFLAKKNNF